MEYALIPLYVIGYVAIGLALKLLADRLDLFSRSTLDADVEWVAMVWFWPVMAGAAFFFGIMFWPALLAREDEGSCEKR